MSGKNVTVSIAGSIIRFAILAVIIAFAFRFATAAYDFGYRVFAEPAMSGEPGVDISVAITDDMSTMEIGKLLEDQGLIADAKLFYVQEKVSEYKDMIRPGVYVLNTSMTSEEMLAIMGVTAESTTEEYGSNTDGSADTALEEANTGMMTEEGTSVEMEETE